MKVGEAKKLICLKMLLAVVILQMLLSAIELIAQRISVPHVIALCKKSNQRRFHPSEIWLIELVLALFATIF